MTIDSGTAHMILDRCQPPRGPRLTSMAIKSVLTGLTSCATPCCPLFPSVPEIAARARCSETTVRRALRFMENEGVLIVERRTRDDGACTSSTYSVDYRRLAAWGGVDLPTPPVTRTGAPVTVQGGPCPRDRGPLSPGPERLGRRGLRAKAKIQSPRAELRADVRSTRNVGKPQLALARRLVHVALHVAGSWCWFFLNSPGPGDRGPRSW